MPANPDPRAPLLWGADPCTCSPDPTIPCVGGADPTDPNIYCAECGAVRTGIARAI